MKNHYWRKKAICPNLLLINLRSYKIVMVNKKSIDHFNLILENINLSDINSIFINEDDKLNIIDILKRKGTID